MLRRASRSGLVVVVGTAGCGPGSAPADAADVPRCFEAIDLFEIDPRAVDSTVTVTDTTGDGVLELWLARVQGGSSDEPTPAVAYVEGPGGDLEPFAEIEVPGALVGFADFDGTGRAELVSAEASTEVEGGAWYRTPIEDTGSAGESRVFDSWTALFERRHWWDLDDDGIADLVQQTAGTGLAVGLSSSSTYGAWMDLGGSIAHVDEVHATSGWLIALTRARQGMGETLHVIEARPTQPLRDIVTDSPIASWYEVHAAMRSDEVSIDVFGTSSTTWGTRVLHRVEIDTASGSAVASIVEPSVQSPRFGDFDGDGAHDVAWRDPVDGELRVRFADRDGTLGAPQSSEAPVLDATDVLSRSPAASIDESGGAVLFVDRPLAEDRLLIRAIRVDACR